MTLEEALSGVKPWRKGQPRLRYPTYYRIISECYDKIEAALKGGYSYGQILEGLKKVYGLDIRYSLLVYYYKKIQKERVND